MSDPRRCKSPQKSLATGFLGAYLIVGLGLVCSASPAAAYTIPLWGGVSSTSTHLDTLGLLLMDECGEAHSFDLKGHISQFCITPTARVNVALEFGRDRVVYKVKLTGEDASAEFLRLTGLYGRPSERIRETLVMDGVGGSAAYLSGAMDYYASVWNVGDLRVVFEDHTHSHRFATDYCVVPKNAKSRDCG